MLLDVPFSRMILSANFLGNIDDILRPGSVFGTIHIDKNSNKYI